MGKSLFKSRTLATEQELQGQSFLARCRAIVAASSPSISNVPVVIKSRGQQFRPRAQQNLRGSRLQLHTPEWNERSIRKTETVLGIVLILIAMILLGLQQNEGGPAPVEAPTISQTSASGSGSEQENAEMPYFFDMLGSTVDEQVNASQSAQLVPSGSSFRSYANPDQFFSFEKQANNMISTHAVSGIANHVEKRLLNSPGLVGSLPRQFGPAANYAPPILPSADQPSTIMKQGYSAAGPICGVMNGFRQLSQILDESCTDSQFAGAMANDE